MQDIARDPWLLDAAMSYALPRCLEHLVQPPLAPTPEQIAEVAAAVAARQQQQQPKQQQQQQPVPMQRTITGGSTVSAASVASGVTAVTNASEGMSSESMNAHADPALVPAAGAPRTSSNSSTETPSRGAKETGIGAPSDHVVRVLSKVTEGSAKQAVQQEQEAKHPQQQQQRDAVGQALQDQSVAPKRVMYASHTTYTPGTGGKVGLGEQQLYAVRYEAQAAQQAAAAADTDTAAGRGASKRKATQCCCVIC